MSHLLYRAFSVMTWQYLLAAVIAVPIVLAIAGRPRGARAIAGRVLAWLVVVSLVFDALRVLRLTAAAGYQWLAVTRLSAVPQSGLVGNPVVTSDPYAAAMLAQTAAQLLALVAGYLLAALLWRRIDWPAVERATGWRLDGWRQWAGWALAGPWFAWLFYPAVPALVLFMLQGDSAFLQPALLTYALGGVIGLVAVLLATWALRELMPRGRTDTPHTAPAIAGRSTSARWLLLIGLVGVLSAGLAAVLTAVTTLLSFAATGSALGGAPMYAEGALTLAITLAPVLAIRRIDWQPLTHLTGIRWSMLAQVLAALTVGSWLTWPVFFVEGLDEAARDPTVVALLWRLVGVGLVAAAVVWLLRYRPRATSDDG